MLRSIVGFHQDEVGDWVADLGCLHGQHVRHRPPFWVRPWVLTESGRAERLGSDLDCPLCDRAEIPQGLHVVRTAGPFDAATLPMGLRADHRVADGRWATLKVLEGAVGFTMDTDPPVAVHLVVGDEQAIPPGVAHRVIVEDGMRVVIDFLEKKLTNDIDAGRTVNHDDIEAAHEDAARRGYEIFWNLRSLAPGATQIPNLDFPL